MASQVKCDRCGKMVEYTILHESSGEYLCRKCFYKLNLALKHAPDEDS